MKGSFLHIVLCIALFFCQSFHIHDDPSDGLYLAAKSKLIGILEMIPEGEEGKYGFNNREEFKNAGLGVLYQEYSLETGQPTGYWRIPVTVDGEYRVILRYRKDTAGKWVWHGVSGTEIARDLAILESNCEKHPATAIFIRDYELMCDFILFNVKYNQPVTGDIIPLNISKRRLSALTGTDAKGRYSVEEIKKLHSGN